ncbi:unnamed protein product [Wickerhamomyces anomalus]
MLLTTVNQAYDKINHQQNLSIHSLNSIVEPLTPPDLGDQTFNSSIFTNNSNGASTASSTPLSSLNTNIGGNTYRSRFKSLPLVNELDQKFNQFNIKNLQNLSQPPQQSFQKQEFNLTLPNNTKAGSGVTNGSIPQISLQQHHSQSAFGAGGAQQPPVPQRQKSQPLLLQQHQHHSSLPTLTFTANSSSASNTSQPQTPKIEIPNYKNYDELNLIPIESLDILKLSVDQYGCRFLQKKLDLDSSIKDVIFNKIFNNLINLIIDPFGNYLIQKLIDHLSTYQKDLMIEKIHGYLFLISINQYGTRSLQKIIDKISNTYQIDLVIKGLQMNDVPNVSIEDNNIVKLIKDLNGNHVIQKCIFKFPPEKFQFLIDSICMDNNIVRISTHKHGCCVLQKLLNNANFNQILKISNNLLIYLDDLINDQFGNYIIQFLFELNFLKSSNSINFLIDDFFNRIYGNLIQLSCLKFSSNVVEKFIKILKHKQNYVYLIEIIKFVDSNFEILIKDKFGNYVIQTLIDQFYDVVELSTEMNNLILNIKSYLPVIKSAPYARKIQLKIQQLETNYKLMSSASSINSFERNGGHGGGNFHTNSAFQFDNDQFRNPKNQYYMNYNSNPHFINDQQFISSSTQFIYPPPPTNSDFPAPNQFQSQ